MSERANVMFRVSKLVPARMTSRYFICNPEKGYPVFPECATWWQWRGRVFRHHREAAFEWAHSKGW